MRSEGEGVCCVGVDCAGSVWAALVFFRLGLRDRTLCVFRQPLSHDETKDTQSRGAKTFDDTRHVNRRALVSMLHDKAAASYIDGARVLLKSALRHAPG